MFHHNTNYIQALINQENENRENENREGDLRDVVTFPQFDFAMFTSSIMLFSSIIELIHIFAGLYVSYLVSRMLGLTKFFSRMIIILSKELDIEFITIGVLATTIVGTIVYFLGRELCYSFDIMLTKYNKLIEDKDEKIDELEDKVTELEDKVTELEDKVTELEDKIIEMNEMNKNDTRNSDEIFVTIEQLKNKY